jgi:hypothetical protein
LAGAAVRLRLGDEAALARIRQVTGCGDNAEEVLRWMGARDRVGRDCERVSSAQRRGDPRDAGGRIRL